MKTQIRKEILALRKELPREEQIEKSKEIAEKVVKHPDYIQAKQILCYIDAKSEVMTSDIIEDAWKQGKEVAVPKVHGEIMKFYKIHSYDHLEEGCFGIKEPKDTCQEVTELSQDTLVIMPGVAFDSEGNRIGYGKGYYDKYFEKYPHIYKIAVAYKLQIVPDIPSKEHDIKANIVLTED